MSNKLLESLRNNNVTQFEKTKEHGKRLSEKWEKYGLLKGIDDPNEKHGMSVMLENQAKELIKEISSTGGTNHEEWSGVALPIVRKVFGNLAAKEFVSIQPMNIPSGLVFYLDFKYSTDQPGFSTTTGSSGQDNSIYGVTNQPGSPDEGLYGAARFGYSINNYEATGLTFVTASADWQDVDFDPNLSGSVASGEIYNVTVDLNNTDFDTEGIRAFEISGSNINQYFPRYTKAVDSSGGSSERYVTFVVSGSSISENDGKVNYHKQPKEDDRGDFEAPADPAYTDTEDNNVGIPEIQMDMASKPIVAKTRKLKAVWTPEFAQDINAYQNIDAEKELTDITSDYISMEIDLEILDMLITNAITKEYWSAKVGEEYVQDNDPWFQAADQTAQGSALAYNQGTWFQTLGTKMQKVSNVIHQKTMRGGANFAVVGPTVATILESIPGYAADTDGNQSQYAMGVQKAGLLNNRWTVYKNPYMPGDTMLMGFRGGQFLETGAVYSPYIPLISTPTIWDQTNMVPRKGFMTRYAKTITRPEFFGLVKVSKLDYI